MNILIRLIWFSCPHDLVVIVNLVCSNCIQAMKEKEERKRKEKKNQQLRPACVYLKLYEILTRFVELLHFIHDNLYSHLYICM